MSVYLAEMLGTCLLMVFGCGSVANVVLGKSKGFNSGFLVITIGWGLAVALAVYAVGSVSGAHINPAVTIALATIGKFPWELVAGYVCAQFAGAFIGAVLVYLAYLPHWRETDDAASKLAVFSTSPAIRSYPHNVLSEFIATGCLVFGVLCIGANELAAGLNPLLVGLLVVAVGHSLGGPTGYAINPARDLGPRIAHFLLPIAGKGSSDFAYSWVPVLAPIAGGAYAGVLYQVVVQDGSPWLLAVASGLSVVLFLGVVVANGSIGKVTPAHR